MPEHRQRLGAHRSVVGEIAAPEVAFVTEVVEALECVDDRVLIAGHPNPQLFGYTNSW